LSLAPEALQDPLGTHPRGNQLDRDFLAEMLVLSNGAEHDPHSAMSDLLEEAIGTHLVTRCGGLRE
jgi:hypothetical protein